MPKLYFGKAISLMTRTLPCLLAIGAANAVFGLMVVLYYVVLFGILAIIPRGMELLSFVILVVGLGGTWGLFKAFRHYFLYLLKAGHVAVMAEYLQNGKLPEGQSQIAFGKAQVTSRFTNVSGMFVVGELVSGVVAVITKTVEGIMSYIPVESLQQLTKIISAVVKMATSYIDEAILARAFIEKDKNIFEVGKEGTILYAMAAKPILFNAAGLALFSWAATALFVGLFTPVGYAINFFLPASISWVGVVAVFIFAYLAKITFCDTFALATTIVAFHEETKALKPDPAWDARLSSVSDKFRELSAKAAGAMGMKPAAANVEAEVRPLTPTLRPA